MSATQTTTTVTRKWNDDKKKKKKKSVASAYSAELKKGKKSRKVCPTCGRPL